MIDTESEKALDELERTTGKSTGIGKIERGECPMGMKNPIACTFCSYGHMLDCHYPATCNEALCGHYAIEE